MKREEGGAIASNADVGAGVHHPMTTHVQKDGKDHEV
jgi:hypothetical protein